MEWIIKANLNLLLFGLIYQLLFHLKGRYTFARIYLLITPLLSLIIPLALLVNIQASQSFSYVLQPVSVRAANTLLASSPYSVLDMLTGIYYAGVVVSLSLFLINLFRLFYAPLKNTAWSFFEWVHIPAASNMHTGMMQLHEEAHIKQWHSADIVYYQLIKAFFWFNPVVYFLFARLKEVHEFSADEYALKQTDDKVFYCELLLNETFGVETHSLINPFHSRSTIFNRITMITQTQPQRVSRWKYLAMLPLLAAVFFLSLTPGNALAQDKKDKVYQGQDLPEVMPEFKGGQQALVKFLSDNISYPADARKEKVEGRVVLKFVVDKTGHITNIENVKESVDVRLVKEAIRVVSAMPAWTPGKDKGQPVDVSFTLPIAFKL
jgi:TonB family protein